MSDLMREEFEQAVVNMHVSHGVPPEDAVAFLETGSNGYRSVSTKSAWWAWQASRECLVIELPAEPECPEDPEEAIDDSHMDAYHSAIRMRNACRDSIHAAGVKTK